MFFKKVSKIQLHVNEYSNELKEFEIPYKNQKNIQMKIDDDQTIKDKLEQIQEIFREQKKEYETQKQKYTKKITQQVKNYNISHKRSQSNGQYHHPAEFKPASYVLNPFENIKPLPAPICQQKKLKQFYESQIKPPPIYPTKSVSCEFDQNGLKVTPELQQRFLESQARMDKLSQKEKIEMRKKAKFHAQSFKPCSSVSKVLGQLPAGIFRTEPEQPQYTLPLKAFKSCRINGDMFERPLSVKQRFLKKIPVKAIAI